MKADKRRDAPRHVQALQARIRNISGGAQTQIRLERAVANVVLAQMLPPGAVKGGTALKLRLGPTRSRFTPDLDVARADTLDQFLEQYSDALTAGWGGFTGRLVPARPARPAGVPADYIMQPFDIKVAYRGRAWMTVRLEVGHDEIGDTLAPEEQLAADLAQVFEALGLPEPQPVPVLRIDHQAAQKLHACSAPGSERAHDLVDLQLLMDGDQLVDLGAVRATCERLFTSRRAHPWPPTITAGPGWTSIYATAAEGMECRQSLDEAVAWANDLVRRICGSTST